MPELPEVEYVSRSLNTLVVGRTIVSAELYRPKLAPATDPRQFAALMADAAIASVGRRGKHILIGLSNDRTLIVHLRMSGTFSVLDPDLENPKFTHAVFHFSDGDRLVFSDQRHFGMMKVVDNADLPAAKELAKLAPEPFSNDFSEVYFREALSRSSRNLKEFLLDQTKVCGLGNIYASEALFAARVDPRIVAGALSKPGSARLYRAIREVLREAIEHNADLPVDPANIDANYFSGGNSSGWFVYDREKMPCVRCKSPIVRLKQGGRSTFFCRVCQRNRRNGPMTV